MVTYTTRRWTRTEYHRLAEFGIFREDEPVELIGGELIVAEPQGRPHKVGVDLAAEVLRGAFGAGWLVRAQSSTELDDESAPTGRIPVSDLSP